MLIVELDNIGLDHLYTVKFGLFKASLDLLADVSFELREL